MSDANDMDLVREFARDNSEAAFTELVRRHLNLVYSVARRCIGNDGDAQDVAQAVFIILARKAAGLREKTLLTGWFYETTRFTAARLLRTNGRRHAREQEAYMQSTLNEADQSEVWEKLAPHLEAAMDKLSQRDRALLVLRFYENKSGPEAAALLGIREDAAHKRVTRAIEKLRKFFVKRGVTLTATAIAGAVSANSVQAAPVALAKTISAVAVAKGAAATTSTLTLVKGALKIMAWTKAKMAVVVGVGILLAAGTTTVTVEKIEQHKADESWRVRPFNSETLEHVSPQVKILPAKLPRGGGWGHGMNGKMMGTGVTAETVVVTAYGFWSFARIIVAAELPKGGYDFIASLPNGNTEALQQEIQKQFGVMARRETIETNVLLLTVKYPNAQGLRHSATRDESSQLRMQPGQFSSVNTAISDLAINLEILLKIPVINESGITNKFDIDLEWNQNDPQHSSLKQALIDQLGLELVPTNMPIEMLVVEKVK
jgi:uncharacterized protein (TIGR03435 family)